METIKIPFGKGKLTIPAEEGATILAPAFGNGPNEGHSPEGDIIRRALLNPIESQPLSQLAAGKQKIVIITSDHTRPVPSKLTLPFLLAEIRKGNPNARITILIATGAHRETTRAEMEDKFGTELLGNETFAIHRSKATDENIAVGIMPNGTELYINRLAKEADLLVSEGFIEPHFFAGFSGGRKSVLPGVADATSVSANHCAKWIDHPRARTGILEGNPIHEEMLKAARLAHLAFIFNVVLDEDKKVIAAFAGHPEKAHLKACSLVARMFTIEAEKADIVIAGNGGYPLDQNIYQAVKGMTAAEAACKEGGVIILLAECSDGHGGDSFHAFFNNNRTIDELYGEILHTPSSKTKPDQWEAQILLRILRKHRVILVSSLPEEMPKHFRLTPAASFEEAFAKAKALSGKAKPAVIIIPDGVSVIVKNKE